MRQRPILHPNGLNRLKAMVDLADGRR